jgi:CO/xanthine dehydrogenase Mo-binding subunit
MASKFIGLHFETVRGGRVRARVARLCTGRGHFEFVVRRSLADAGAWVLMQHTETMLEVISAVKGAEFPTEQAAINHANVIGATIWDNA